jgi:excisionase family DNA binding protein
MSEQILFSGVTLAQFTEIIISGVKEELSKLMLFQKSENESKNEEFFTIKEACDFLRCSETKLWRLRKKELVKSYENGRGVLLKKSDLENYLKSSKI